MLGSNDAARAARFRMLCFSGDAAARVVALQPRDRKLFAGARVAAFRICKRRSGRDRRFCGRGRLQRAVVHELIRLGTLLVPASKLQKDLVKITPTRGR